MKQALLRAVLLLLMPLWACASQAAEPLRLRVLSYNIHHGEGVDGKLDLERIAQVMLSVKPDLVAVQEVDQKVLRTKSIDQPALLARLTKMHVAFGANIKLQGGEYGNAILSRFPIVRHTNHFLPNVHESEQRGVIVAEIELPNRKSPLLFVATHLDFRADDRERLASAKVINDLVTKNAHLSGLLAGDLNDTPESKTLRQLELMWTRANNTALLTIPVDRPAKQIDFILLRPADHWKVIEVRALDEAVASDHRAIFAILELVPNSQE